MATAADVPGTYDLVIGSTGYVFLDALEPSLPFRTHRAIYSYTPTFIERSNVSGNFGDNQQDFFLTSSQRDWSEGEQQRYYRASDQDSVRRYWVGSKVDITRPGKVSIRDDTLSITAASAIKAMCDNNDGILFATTTNWYTLGSNGAITDNGAHGLGAAPTGMVDDDVNTYVASMAGGSVGVRKLVGTPSTFSASGADQLAYLNNTLYGYVAPLAKLVKYDSAGVQSDVAFWKGAAGGAQSLATARLAAFGGKLLILLNRGGTNRAELWQYDGSGVSMIYALPSTFVPWDIDILGGSAFISGRHILGGSSVRYRPAIYFYASGTTGLLWQSDTVTTSDVQVSISDFGNGLIWNDDIAGKLMFWDAATGGFHSVGAYTVAGDTPRLASSWWNVLHSRNQTTAYVFPGTSLASSSSVTTSLFDFDSSLTKTIRGVTVEFDSATDGNGGSVDVAYRVGDVDGSYTSLATGVTSGTETVLSGVSGKSISIQVTLNKGTSTAGPVLKRIYVRAAPILTAFRMGEYVLDCTGDGGRSPRSLRDGTPNPLSGSESMAALEAAKASATPLTITDRRGTYTGYIETLEGYEEHPGIDDPTRSGEFVVKLITRGV